MRKILILVLVIFLQVLTACKEEGTEGGNPGSNPHMGLSSYAIGLGEFICFKRSACLQQNDKNCMSQLMVNPDVTTELSLNTLYSTLADVDVAEEKKLISVEKPKYSECMNAIQKIDCSDSLTTEAFQAGDYSRLHVILRSSLSCRESFKAL